MIPVSSPQQTRRRLGLLFSVPLLFWLVFFLFQLRSEQTDIRLLNIQNLESTVDRLNSLAKDAESSERGFLLTGEISRLSSFNRAKIELPKERTFMLRYGPESDDFRPALLHLADLAQSRLSETEKVLRAQQQDGFAAGIDVTKTGIADSIMNNLRRESIDLLKKLNRREDQYLKNQRNLSTDAFIFFGIGAVVMIAVMYWLYNEVLGSIEARDQAQQQLQYFNADLQTMVDDRTRELVEANRELQQFTYVASHDLQEPLRTITSFSQLLAGRYKGRLDDEADEFIGYIVTSSKRMTDLINGLLEIVRLRKSSQNNTLVSFDRLLDDAEAGLQASIRENEVRIERGKLPELVVDRVQMLQVFQNLISNAIKYRSVAPPHIRISSVRTVTEWIISVSDNGRGFDQQFSERIFGLFQRLHGRDIEGTGMGLSIARRIIERHAGRIWAESKVGVGTTFFFALPLSLEAGSVLPPAQPEITSSGLTPRPGKARAF